MTRAQVARAWLKRALLRTSSTLAVLCALAWLGTEWTRATLEIAPESLAPRWKVWAATGDCELSFRHKFHEPLVATSMPASPKAWRWGSFRWYPGLYEGTSTFVSSTAPENWCIWGTLTAVRFPLWLPTLLFALPGSVVLARTHLHRRVRPGHCICGYNLTGNVSGVCPECGRAVASAADSAK